MIYRVTAFWASLVIAAGAGLAYGQSYADWTVNLKNPSAYSVTTVNDSGRVLGQYCFFDDNTCYWLIELDSSCEESHKYPVLANGDTGAVSLELFCHGRLDDGGYAYAFTNFDQVDKIIGQSNQVGFAIPMQDDEFRVVRFNVRGAARALSAMAEALAKRSKAVPKNTRDKRL